MKKILFNGLIIFLFCLNACKKNEPAASSQGTKFNLLLKTVSKLTTLNGEVITEYSYDNNNLLAAIKTTDNITPTAPGLQTQSFYRNVSGQLDSIIYVAKTNGVVTNATKTFFTYDAVRKMILSTYAAEYDSGSSTKDSSLYFYDGDTLQNRIDYRSFDGGHTYILLRQAAYEFDAEGNLSKTIFHWPTNPAVDTLRFQYDTKENPVPLWGGFFYWAPLFYNDYKPQHNLTQANGMNAGGDSYFEYQYAPNNKPLYRKQTQPGGLDNAQTYYYYD